MRDLSQIQQIEPEKGTKTLIKADDYVRKPFHIRELLARIRVNARRAEPEVTKPRKECTNVYPHRRPWPIDRR